VSLPLISDYWTHISPTKHPHCVYYAGDTHPTFVAQHLLLNNVEQQMLSDFPCHTSDFCRSTLSLNRSRSTFP